MVSGLTVWIISWRYADFQLTLHFEPNVYSWILTRSFIIFKIYGINVIINHLPNQQIYEIFLMWLYVHNCHDKYIASPCIQMQISSCLLFFTPIDLWTIMAAATWNWSIETLQWNCLNRSQLGHTFLFEIERLNRTYFSCIYDESKNHQK